MRRHKTVNLGNLVLSLSDAMDLANPLLTQHQQRTAFIVWKMGLAAGLPSERLEHNFIAALLHDIGAFSFEEKLSLQRDEAEDVERHTIRGERLLSSLPWLAEPARIIRFHHKEWTSWGASTDQVVFDSQMLALADCVERAIDRDHFILHQNVDIIAKMQSYSGTVFSPEAVQYFLSVSDRESFWLDLVSPRIYSLLLNEGPFKTVAIEGDDILAISELFRNVIDFRSRFTSTHSSGVAACASMLADCFGLTESETVLIEVAGNLHDIGKLAISNDILEKQDRLTGEEMEIMRSHTYHTYHVISTIQGFEEIAEWAAFHHEKLDGTGYPFHCDASELTTGSRIMAVADIFTALAEDRPYRKGMAEEGIARILTDHADRGLLDGRIVDLLLDNFEKISVHVAARQAATGEFYERQFSTNS